MMGSDRRMNHLKRAAVACFWQVRRDKRPEFLAALIFQGNPKIQIFSGMSPEF